MAAAQLIFLAASCYDLQVTALGTVIVGTSATMFAWHGARGNLAAAAFHPPVMYCLLVALLCLPANFAYKVRWLTCNSPSA